MYAKTFLCRFCSKACRWRSAIARALVHRPLLLIADEPTGNLDTISAERVLSLLREIAHDRLTTLVLVTHSAEVAAAAARLIEMRDGKVVNDTLQPRS